MSGRNSSGGGQNRNGRGSNDNRRGRPASIDEDAEMQSVTRGQNDNESGNNPVTPNDTLVDSNVANPNEAEISPGDTDAESTITNGEVAKKKRGALAGATLTESSSSNANTNLNANLNANASIAGGRTALSPSNARGRDRTVRSRTPSPAGSKGSKRTDSPWSGSYFALGVQQMSNFFFAVGTPGPRPGGKMFSDVRMNEGLDSPDGGLTRGRLDSSRRALSFNSADEEEEAAAAAANSSSYDHVLLDTNQKNRNAGKDPMKAPRPSLFKVGPVEWIFRFIVEFFSWLGNLRRCYGGKLLLILVLSQHVLKGFVFAYLATSLDFVFKFFMVSGPRVQIYKAVAMCPWSLKPLFGIMSDKVPIFGYHKSSYMIIFSVIAIVAHGIVGVNGFLYYSHDEPSHAMPALRNVLTLEICVICFFFGFAQISVCDLLTEAKYAARMRDRPEMGPDLMTFVWGGISVGALIGLASIGFVLENFGAFVPFLVCSLVCGSILIPIAMGYMEEERVGSKQDDSTQPGEQTHLLENSNTQVAAAGDGATATLSNGKNSAAAASNGKDSTQSKRESGDDTTPGNVPNELTFLAIFMGIMALTMVFTGLLPNLSVNDNFIIGVVLACLVLFCFNLLTSPIIGNMNLFFFLQTSFAISIEGASLYFFTDSIEEFKNGPHFSIWFYTTGIGLVASVCNIVGMLMYNTYMKHWRYHSLIIFGNFLICGISLMGVMVYTRFNVKIGIPDHVFVLGGAVLASVVHQWLWLPGVVLLSQLCPQGVEATMYALLGGCHNVGNAVGQYNGAFTLNMLNIKPTGAKNEDAQFDNMWIAAVVQCTLPMITLFLLPYLIPDATQKQTLLGKSATGVDNSIWRRYVMGESEKDIQPTEEETSGETDGEGKSNGKSNGEAKENVESSNVAATSSGSAANRIEEGRHNTVEADSFRGQLSTKVQEVADNEDSKERFRVVVDDNDYGSPSATIPSALTPPNTNASVIAASSLNGPNEDGDRSRGSKRGRRRRSSGAN